MSKLGGLLKRRDKPAVDAFPAADYFTEDNEQEDVPVILSEDTADEDDSEDFINPFDDEEHDEAEELLGTPKSDTESTQVNDNNGNEPVTEPYQKPVVKASSPNRPSAQSPIYTPTEEDKEPAPTLPAEAYSQTLEHMITDILAQNEVKNISLAAFGAHSKLYAPSALSLIRFKEHVFVGIENDTSDLLNIFFMLEDLIREKEKVEGSSASVVVKLVRPFAWNGITYNSLLLTEEELANYAMATGRKIARNDTPVEEDLRLIIYGKNHR